MIINETTLNQYPFYDNNVKDFKEKGYERILFQSENTLSQNELSALDVFAEEKLKKFVKNVHGDNRIIDGINISAINDIGRSMSFTKGSVILNGLVYELPDYTVQYFSHPNCNIYIVLDEHIIMPKEDVLAPYSFADYKNDGMGNSYLINDKELLDPTVESDNYNQPGANRIKRWARYILDPNFEEYPYYIYLATIEDGLLIQLANGITPVNTSILPPNILFNDDDNDTYDKYLSIMESRTFDESGNYLVNGLKVYDGVECLDNDKYGIRITRGTAYIEGKKINLSETNYYISKKSGSMKTTTELYTTTSDGRVLLNNTNIIDISNLKVTQTIPCIKIIRDPSNPDFDLFKDYTTIDNGPLPPCLDQSIAIHNTPYDNRITPPKRPYYKQGIDYILDTPTTIKWLNKPGSKRPSFGETYYIWYNGLDDVPTDNYTVTYGYDIEQKVLITDMPGIITIPENNLNQNIHIIKIMDSDEIQLFEEGKHYSVNRNTIYFPHQNDNFPIHLTVTKSYGDVDHLPFAYETYSSIPVITHYNRSRVKVYRENIDYVTIDNRIEWKDYLKNAPSEGDSFVATTFINSPVPQNTRLKIFYIAESLDKANNIYENYHAMISFPMELPLNSKVQITYSYIPEKYDRIYVNKNGNISHVNSFNDGSYPKNSTNKIDLADLMIKYLGHKPIIRHSDKYNMKMSDLRNLSNDVHDIQYNLAMTQLEKTAEELAGNLINLRGLFVDPFESFNNFDMQYIQNVLGIDYPYNVAVPNVLTKKIELNEHKITGLLNIDKNSSSSVGVSDQGYVTINKNYKEVLWKSQTYVSDAKSISLNSDVILNIDDPTTYNDLYLLTPKVEISPNTDYFVSGTDIFNQIYEYTITKIIEQSLNYNETLFHYGIKTINQPERYVMSKVYVDDADRVYDWQIIDSTLYEWDGNNTMIQEYIEQYIDNIYSSLFLRPIIITVNAQGFRPFQEKIELTFDGKWCPLNPYFPPDLISSGWEADSPGNGLMKADGEGKFIAQFIIPPKTNFGDKEIVISAPGIKLLTTTFHSVGYMADIENLIEETNIMDLIKSKYGNYFVSFDGYLPNVRFNSSYVDNWDICPIAQTFSVNKLGYRSYADKITVSEDPTEDEILAGSDVWVTGVDVFFKHPGDYNEVEVNSWFTTVDRLGYPEFKSDIILMNSLTSGAIREIPDPITLLPRYSDDSKNPCKILSQSGYPVRLDGDQLWAYCIGSYDKSITAFYGKTQKNDILNTSIVVPTNADRGVLLSSDKSKKWEIFLDEDLKYNIYIADFSEGLSTNVEVVDGVKYYKNYVYYEPLSVADFSLAYNNLPNIPHFTYCNNCVFTIETFNKTNDDSVDIRYELSIDLNPELDKKRWIRFENGQVNEFLTAVKKIWVRAILYTKNKYNTPVISSKVVASIHKYVPKGLYVSNTINLSNQVNEIEIYLDKYISNKGINRIDVEYSTDGGLLWRVPVINNIIPIVIDKLRKEVVYQNKYKNLLYLAKPEITNIINNTGTINTSNFSLNGETGTLNNNCWYKVSLTDTRGYETDLSNSISYIPNVEGFAELTLRIDPHATGYKVYRSDTIESGPYKLIYDSSMITYLDEDLNVDMVQVKVSDIDFVKKLPKKGRLRINNEIVYYYSIDTAKGIIHGLQRGVEDSIRLKHLRGTMVEFFAESELNINNFTSVVGGAGKMPSFEYSEIGKWPEIKFYDYGIDTKEFIHIEKSTNIPYYTSDNIKIKVDMQVLDRSSGGLPDEYKILIDSMVPDIYKDTVYDSGPLSNYIFLGDHIIIDSTTPPLNADEYIGLMMTNRTNIPEAGRLIVISRMNEVGLAEYN